MSSFEILKYDSAYIELIENYPCENKDQLNRREGQFIRETEKCVNKAVAGRTYAEYYADNKDMKLKIVKTYNEANKDAIAKRKKDYYEANKDVILAKAKLYREANKHTIAEKQRIYYIKRTTLKQESEKTDCITNEHESILC